MQTCLWMALEKQTGGDRTRVTSNQVSDQCNSPLCLFGFFFLGLHMRKVEQVSAHPVKVPGTSCLHSQHYSLVLGARGATETSLHSWKVRNSWMQCQESPFHCVMGYQTTMAQPQLVWLDLWFLFQLLLWDGSCLTVIGQRLRQSSNPFSSQHPGFTVLLKKPCSIPSRDVLPTGAYFFPSPHQLAAALYPKAWSSLSLIHFLFSLIEFLIIHMNV